MKKKTSNPLVPFENKWVALSPDRKEVIASSKKIGTLNSKLNKMGREEAILTRVPPFDKYYSP